MPAQPRARYWKQRHHEVAPDEGARYRSRPGCLPLMLARPERRTSLRLWRRGQVYVLRLELRWPAHKADHGHLRRCDEPAVPAKTERSA